MLCALAISLATPARAWAAEGVASIGGTDYTTLQAAVDAAVDGDTIVLNSDVTLDTACVQDTRYCLGISNKSITIDGQGQYTISSSFNRGIYVYGGDSEADRKTVTIKNVTIDKVGDHAITTRGGYINLVVDGVTINTTGSGNNQCVVVSGNQS